MPRLSHGGTEGGQERVEGQSKKKCFHCFLEGLNNCLEYVDNRVST